VEQCEHHARVEGGDVESDRICFFSRTVVSLLHADRDLVGSLFNAISVAVVRECVDDPSIALPRPRRRHLRDPTQLLKPVTRHPTHCHPPQTPTPTTPRPLPSRNSHRVRPPKDRIGSSGHSAAPCPDTAASACPGALSKPPADVQSRRSKPALTDPP